MESCGGSHHWARRLTEAGFTVKLIPAQYVKPYTKRNKNDANDAAICEASTDLWVAQHRRRLKSDMIVVRYADDSVLGFQKHADATTFLHFLKARLAKFGLKIHPDKTRLVRFGRYALAQFAEKPSRSKPGTFDFLGFTHYIGRKRSGEVVVKRKTKRSRMLNQLKALKENLRKRLHWRPSDVGKWLHRVVTGHINYYGVPFNGRSLKRFVHEVKKSWLKSLRRRSQRHKMDWAPFNC